MYKLKGVYGGSFKLAFRLTAGASRTWAPRGSHSTTPAPPPCLALGLIEYGPRRQCSVMELLPHCPGPAQGTARENHLIIRPAGLDSRASTNRPRHLAKQRIRSGVRHRRGAALTTNAPGRRVRSSPQNRPPHASRGGGSGVRHCTSKKTSALRRDRV